MVGWGGLISCLFFAYVSNVHGPKGKFRGGKGVTHALIPIVRCLCFGSYAADIGHTNFLAL